MPGKLSAILAPGRILRRWELESTVRSDGHQEIPSESI